MGDKSILKRENTAHIAKMGIEGIVAVASLAGAIAAILIATKVIAGPASLSLIASPAGIAVLFIATVYFAAAACTSYQQMHANEKVGVKGKDGEKGKDANFATLVEDAVKSGTIVEETVKDANNADIKQLSLKLSATDYAAFTQGKNAGNEITLNVLLADKSVKVKFKHVDAANDSGNCKVQLTSVGDQDQLIGMKKGLDMAADSKSLKVAVSDKGLEALKNGVSTKLGEVAVNAALSKIAK
ncbi:MAG: hypothetical protein ACR5LA_08275 [Wolbachia sp.]